MNWQTPRYDEIKMDAEIGSYQPDSDSPPDWYGGSPFGNAVATGDALRPAAGDEPTS